MIRRPGLPASRQPPTPPDHLWRTVSCSPDSANSASAGTDWSSRLSAIFLVLAGVLGTGVFSQLSTGGFDDPASESVRADRVLAEQFHTGAPNLIFLVDVDASGHRGRPSGVPAVDAADVTAAADGVLQTLRADPAIDEAVSYWSLGNVAPLRNTGWRRRDDRRAHRGRRRCRLRGHHPPASTSSRARAVRSRCPHPAAVRSSTRCRRTSRVT